jgi:hypothetical protein
MAYKFTWPTGPLVKETVLGNPKAGGNSFNRSAGGQHLPCASAPRAQERSTMSRTAYLGNAAPLIRGIHRFALNDNEGSQSLVMREHKNHWDYKG